MLSRELEETLRRAMSNATDRNHEFATLEHLLLALVEDSDALEVLSACKVDIDELRARLLDYIETELTSIMNPNSGADVQPTASFQRVIQRSIIHTQSSGREVATGANVLVAIFSERESHAVWFLKSLNMTRLDAVTYISHGAENAGSEPGTLFHPLLPLRRLADHTNRPTRIATIVMEVREIAAPEGQLLPRPN